MTHIRGIQAADSPSIDAFSRWRVSNPAYRFDSQMTYQIEPELYDTMVSGAGSSVTHSAAKGLAVLTVGTGATDYAILQQHYYSPYSPGRSQAGIPTFRFGSGVANVLKRVGYFDANDGFFLEQNGVTDLAIVQRTNVSGTPDDTNRIVQANWNLDTLDGSEDSSNPSGITLDIADSQIFIVDFQALYVGRVRIGFDVNGIIYYVHEFLNANLRADPYIRNANLPLRWEIRNSAISAGTTMDAICGSVFSEGGKDLFDIPGFPWFTSNGITTIGVTTRRPILSVRPKTLFNSITNRGLIIPVAIEVIAQTNPAYVEVVRNGTLTNASFASVNAQSIAEFDVAATAISGGDSIFGFFAPAGSGSTRVSSSQNLLGKTLLSLAANGTDQDILSIVCTSFAATSTVSGVIDWKEIR